nr:probable manganese-transporting ATPase PDR2 [Tanacetum cinerariifolium]
LPSHIKPIPTVASSQPKKTQKHRKTKRKVTEIFQSSGPTTLVADETVYKEIGDKVEIVATTTSSLEAEQDNDTPAQTRFERLSKQSHKPPLLRVNTLRSGEDNMQLMELMELGTTLPNKVLDLENVKDAQALEIQKLKKRVRRRMHPTRRGMTKMKRFHLFKKRQRLRGVTSAGVSVSTSEPSTPPSTTTTLIEDKDLTNSYTLKKMKSVKSKEKSKEKGVSSTRRTRGVIMKEASKTVSRPIVPPQQQLDPKDKGKERVARQREEEANLISWDNTQAMMEADYELAQRLQAKERGELTIEERSNLFIELIDKRKKHFAKLRAKEIKRKPPTKAQKRNQMCIYLKNMANYKHSQLKNKSFKEIQMLFENTIKWINSIVPMDSEVLEGSGKKVESREKKQEGNRHLHAGREGGRIVGFKRLLSAVEVTTADMEVTTAGVTFLNEIPTSKDDKTSSETKPTSKAKATKPEKPKYAAKPSSSSVIPAANNRHLTRANWLPSLLNPNSEVQSQKLKKMMDELKERDNGRLAPIVKLGDASMAK